MGEVIYLSEALKRKAPQTGGRSAYVRIDYDAEGRMLGGVVEGESPTPGAFGDYAVDLARLAGAFMSIAYREEGREHEDCKHLACAMVFGSLVWTWLDDAIEGDEHFEWLDTQFDAAKRSARLSNEA